MADQGIGQGNKARPGSRRVAQWMRDYVPLPGIPDEYIAQDGTPRAVWSRFFEAFAALNGPAFYGLPPNEARITLRREPLALPEHIGEGENALVPFRGGETLRWRLSG